MLGFSHFVYNSPSGKWGGLLFIWHPRLDVETVYIFINVIAMLVYFDLAHIPCLFNLDYYPAQKKHKVQFWSLLNSLIANYFGTLISIGDFNTILKQ